MDSQNQELVQQTLGNDNSQSNQNPTQTDQYTKSKQEAYDNQLWNNRRAFEDWYMNMHQDPNNPNYGNPLQTPEVRMELPAYEARRAHEEELMTKGGVDPQHIALFRAWDDQIANEFNTGNTGPSVLSSDAGNITNWFTPEYQNQAWANYVNQENAYNEYVAQTHELQSGDISEDTMGNLQIAKSVMDELSTKDDEGIMAWYNSLDSNSLATLDLDGVHNREQWLEMFKSHKQQYDATVKSNEVHHGFGGQVIDFFSSMTSGFLKALWKPIKSVIELGAMVAGSGAEMLGYKNAHNTWLLATKGALDKVDDGIDWLATGFGNWQYDKDGWGYKIGNGVGEFAGFVAKTAAAVYTFGGTAAAEVAVDAVTEAAVESATDAAAEAVTEGAVEGATEAALESTTTKVAEGTVEGTVSKAGETAVEGATEGAVEGATEETADAAAEGIVNKVTSNVVESKGAELSAEELAAKNVAEDFSKGLTESAIKKQASNITKESEESFVKRALQKAENKIKAGHPKGRAWTTREANAIRRDAESGARRVYANAERRMLKGGVKTAAQKEAAAAEWKAAQAERGIVGKTFASTMRGAKGLTKVANVKNLVPNLFRTSGLTTSSRVITRMMAIENAASTVELSAQRGDSLSETLLRTTLSYGTSNWFWGKVNGGAGAGFISKFIKNGDGKLLKSFSGAALKNTLVLNAKMVAEMQASGAITDVVNDAYAKYPQLNSDGTPMTDPQGNVIYGDRIKWMDAVQGSLKKNFLSKEAVMSMATNMLTGMAFHGSTQAIAFVKETTMRHEAAYVDQHMSEKYGQYWEQMKEMAGQNDPNWKSYKPWVKTDRAVAYHLMATGGDYRADLQEVTVKSKLWGYSMRAASIEQATWQDIQNDVKLMKHVLLKYGNEDVQNMSDEDLANLIMKRGTPTTDVTLRGKKGWAYIPDIIMAHLKDGHYSDITDKLEPEEVEQLSKLPFHQVEAILNSAIKRSGRTEQWEDANSRYNQAKQRMGDSESAIESLGEQLGNLRNSLTGMTAGTKEYNDTISRIDQTQKQIDAHQQRINKFNSYAEAAKRDMSSEAEKFKEHIKVALKLREAKPEDISIIMKENNLTLAQLNDMQAQGIDVSHAIATYREWREKAADNIKNWSGSKLKEFLAKYKMTDVEIEQLEKDGLIDSTQSMKAKDALTESQTTRPKNTKAREYKRVFTPEVKAAIKRLEKYNKDRRAKSGIELIDEAQGNKGKFFVDERTKEDLKIVAEANKQFTGMQINEYENNEKLLLEDLKTIPEIETDLATRAQTAFNDYHENIEVQKKKALAEKEKQKQEAQKQKEELAISKKAESRRKTIEALVDEAIESGVYEQIKSDGFAKFDGETPEAIEEQIREFRIQLRKAKEKSLVNKVAEQVAATAIEGQMDAASMNAKRERKELEQTRKETSEKNNQQQIDVQTIVDAIATGIKDGLKDFIDSKKEDIKSTDEEEQSPITTAPVPVEPTPQPEGPSEGGASASFEKDELKNVVNDLIDNVFVEETKTEEEQVDVKDQVETIQKIVVDNNAIPDIVKPVDVDTISEAKEVADEIVEGISDEEKTVKEITEGIIAGAKREIDLTDLTSLKTLGIDKVYKLKKNKKYAQLTNNIKEFEELLDSAETKEDIADIEKAIQDTKEDLYKFIENNFSKKELISMLSAFEINEIEIEDSKGKVIKKYAKLNNGKDVDAEFLDTNAFNKKDLIKTLLNSNKVEKMNTAFIEAQKANAVVDDAYRASTMYASARETGKMIDAIKGTEINKEIINEPKIKSLLDTAVGVAANREGVHFNTTIEEELANAIQEHLDSVGAFIPVGDAYEKSIFDWSYRIEETYNKKLSKSLIDAAESKQISFDEFMVRASQEIPELNKFTLTGIDSSLKEPRRLEDVLNPKTLSNIIEDVVLSKYFDKKTMNRYYLTEKGIDAINLLKGQTKTDLVKLKRILKRYDRITDHDVKTFTRIYRDVIEKKSLVDAAVEKDGSQKTFEDISAIIKYNGNTIQGAIDYVEKQSKQYSDSKNKVQDKVDSISLEIKKAEHVVDTIFNNPEMVKKVNGQKVFMKIAKKLWSMYEGRGLKIDYDSLTHEEQIVDDSLSEYEKQIDSLNSLIETSVTKASSGYSMEDLYNDVALEFGEDEAQEFFDLIPTDTLDYIKTENKIFDGVVPNKEIAGKTKSKVINFAKMMREQDFDILTEDEILDLFKTSSNETSESKGILKAYVRSMKKIITLRNDMKDLGEKLKVHTDNLDAANKRLDELYSAQSSLAKYSHLFGDTATIDGKKVVGIEGRKKSYQSEVKSVISETKNKINQTIGKTYETVQELLQDVMNTTFGEHDDIYIVPAGTGWKQMLEEQHMRKAYNSGKTFAAIADINSQRINVVGINELYDVNKDQHLYISELDRIEKFGEDEGIKGIFSRNNIVTISYKPEGESTYASDGKTIYTNLKIAPTFSFDSFQIIGEPTVEESHGGSANYVRRRMFEMFDGSNSLQEYNKNLESRARVVLEKASQAKEISYMLSKQFDDAINSNSELDTEGIYKTINQIKSEKIKSINEDSTLTDEQKIDAINSIVDNNDIKDEEFKGLIDDVESLDVPLSSLVSDGYVGQKEVNDWHVKQTETLSPFEEANYRTAAWRLNETYIKQNKADQIFNELSKNHKDVFKNFQWTKRRDNEYMFMLSKEGSFIKTSINKMSFNEWKNESKLFLSMDDKQLTDAYNKFEPFAVKSSSGLIKDATPIIVYKGQPLHEVASRLYDGITKSNPVEKEQKDSIRRYYESTAISSMVKDVSTPKELINKIKVGAKVSNDTAGLLWSESDLDEVLLYAGTEEQLNNPEYLKEFSNNIQVASMLHAGKSSSISEINFANDKEDVIRLVKALSNPAVKENGGFSTDSKYVETEMEKHKQIELDLRQQSELKQKQILSLMKENKNLRFGELDKIEFDDFETIKDYEDNEKEIQKSLDAWKESRDLVSVYETELKGLSTFEYYKDAEQVVDRISSGDVRMLERLLGKHQTSYDNDKGVNLKYVTLPTKKSEMKNETKNVALEKTEVAFSQEDIKPIIEEIYGSTRSNNVISVAKALVYHEISKLPKRVNEHNIFVTESQRKEYEKLSSIDKDKLTEEQRLWLADKNSRIKTVKNTEAKRKELVSLIDPSNKEKLLQHFEDGFNKHLNSLLSINSKLEKENLNYSLLKNKLEELESNRDKMSSKYEEVKKRVGITEQQRYNNLETIKALHEELKQIELDRERNNYRRSLKYNAGSREMVDYVISQLLKSESVVFDKSQPLKVMQSISEGKAYIPENAWGKKDYLSPEPDTSNGMTSGYDSTEEGEQPERVAVTGIELLKNEVPKDLSIDNIEPELMGAAFQIVNRVRRLDRSDLNRTEKNRVKMLDTQSIADVVGPNLTTTIDKLIEPTRDIITLVDATQHTTVKDLVKSALDIPKSKKQLEAEEKKEIKVLEDSTVDDLDQETDKDNDPCAV